jgi:hypothetical protein
MSTVPVRPKGLSGPEMVAWERALSLDESQALGRAEVAQVNRDQLRLDRDAARREQERYAARPDVRAVHMLELIYGQLEDISIALQQIARDATPH